MINNVLQIITFIRAFYNMNHMFEEQLKIVFELVTSNIFNASIFGDIHDFLYLNAKNRINIKRFRGWFKWLSK